MEQLKESHRAELEQVGQEKDMRILELLQSLDELRVELAADKEAEAESKEMESTATQTEPSESSEEPASEDKKEEEEDGPAVLPVESQTDSVRILPLTVDGVAEIKNSFQAPNLFSVPPV